MNRDAQKNKLVTFYVVIYYQRIIDDLETVTEFLLGRLRSSIFFCCIIAFENTSPYDKEGNTKVLWSRHTRTR